MTRLATLAAVVASALAAATPAAALTFTPGPGAPANLPQIERAIRFQINHQVVRYYDVDPVRFATSGGDPIYFVPLRTLRHLWNAGGGRRGAPVIAFHTFDGVTGQHPIYVARMDRDTETTALSHEIIETEVDPLASDAKLEIADPVDGQMYRLWGVAVSNWIKPNGRAFH